MFHFAAEQFPHFVGIIFIQDEDASGGDQDQEERRWNKRTQQMLHGLQVCQGSLTGKCFIKYFGHCCSKIKAMCYNQKTYSCKTSSRTT